MLTPLRLAVIGLGHRGTRLAKTLGDLPGVAVAMLCDNHPQALAGLQDHFPRARRVTHLTEVVQGEIDAAAIAVPMAENGPVATALLAAGRHCLLEPPLATTAEQCRQLVETAWRHDAHLMVNHTHVFDPGVHQVHGLLRSGDLGSLRHLYFQRMRPGRNRGGGDALWHHTSHDVAIALHWLNDQMPDRVRAFGFSQFGDPPADMVHLVLSYASGCNIQFTTSLLTPESSHRILLAGSARMAVLDDADSTFRLRIHQQGLQKEWLSGNLPLPNDGAHEIHIPRLTHADPLREACRHFLQGIRQQQRPLCDGLSGLRVVRILETAAASLAAGGVALPLEEGL